MFLVKKYFIIVKKVIRHTARIGFIWVAPNLFAFILIFQLILIVVIVE